MKTFTEYPFEFQEARIVGGDERAGVGVMGGLKGLDGMKEEGRGITSGEERLREVAMMVLGGRGMGRHQMISRNGWCL